MTLHSELSVETNLVLECATCIGVEFSEETNLFPPIPLPFIPIGEFATVQPQITGHIGSYEQWPYYHQLAAPIDGPGDDSDSDGVSNSLEAYFALDPHAPSVLPPLRIETEHIGGENVPVLEFQRAAYAGSLGYGLETSIDLSAWRPLPAGFTMETEPADTPLESVRVFSTPPDPRRFFRISGDPAP